MRIALIAAGLVACLLACSSATPIRTPSGRQGYVISGSTRNYAIEAAAEACGGRPYNVLDGPTYDASTGGTWSMTVECL